MRPRIVRRTIVHCPATEAAVEIELLMKATGPPAHPECPPTCDQACRTMAEAVLTSPRALIICPPGRKGRPEETG